METRLYLITYDIASRRRWRRVFRALDKRGAWQQLSAFACRLTPTACADLERDLLALLDADQDRLMIVDLGAGPDAEARLRRHGMVESLPAARVQIF